MLGLGSNGTVLPTEPRDKQSIDPVIQTRISVPGADESQHGGREGGNGGGRKKMEEVESVRDKGIKRKEKIERENKRDRGG